MQRREDKQGRDSSVIRILKKDNVGKSTKARNVTSNFCNNLLIIRSHYACKICS